MTEEDEGDQQHRLNKTEDDDAEGGDEGNALKNAEDENERKIFVGGLSWESRESDLKEYFEKFGAVESVTLKLDPMTGKSRCFAFVVFESKESVGKILGEHEDNNRDHAVNSKKVEVKRAKAKPGKIFVGGLKPEMTDEQIKEAFEIYGKIIEFDMPFDKAKQQRKGFGFITFEKEETMKVLVKMQKVNIGEHKVDLRKATPKQPPMDGGGGGFFGHHHHHPRHGGAGPNYWGSGGGGGWDYYGDYNYFGHYPADYYEGADFFGWGNARGGGKMKKKSTAQGEQQQQQQQPY